MRLPRWNQIVGGVQFLLILAGPDAPSWARAFTYVEYEGMEWCARGDLLIGFQPGTEYTVPDGIEQIEPPDWACQSC